MCPSHARVGLGAGHPETPQPLPCGPAALRDLPAPAVGAAGACCGCHQMLRKWEGAGGEEKGRCFIRAQAARAGYFAPQDLIPALVKARGGYSRRVHGQRVSYQKEN